MDVRSLRLERANGDVVETVPLTTRIDFSEVADLTEFFTVATVPAGTYTRVVMNFDFTNAQIVVQGDDGAELPVVPVDSNGKRADHVGRGDRTAGHGAGSYRSWYSGGVHARFRSRCIEYGRSHQQSCEGDGAAVPVGDSAARSRTATIVCAACSHRPMSTRSTVTLNVRPFHLRQGEFGEVTFATNDQTHFEVNGAALTGAEGLAAVASLAQGTPVVANGAVIESYAHRIYGTGGQQRAVGERRRGEWCSDRAQRRFVDGQGRRLRLFRRHPWIPRRGHGAGG